MTDIVPEKSKNDICFSVIDMLIELINGCDPALNIGFEAFSGGDPEARLSILSGDFVSERFFDGGAVIGLPFRITVRKRNGDRAASLELLHTLYEVSKKLLSCNLKETSDGARLISICRTSLPLQVGSFKDGTEEYASDFVLFYCLT